MNVEHFSVSYDRFARGLASVLAKWERGGREWRALMREEIERVLVTRSSVTNDEIEGDSVQKVALRERLKVADLEVTKLAEALRQRLRIEIDLTP